MNQVLQGLDLAIAYLDDTVIFSKNKLEHVQFSTGCKMPDSNSKNLSVTFIRSQIHYLGDILSAGGIQPLPEKLDSITNLPALENKTEVKQFLGLVGTITNLYPGFQTCPNHWKS